MPIGDIAGELLGGVIRFAARLVFEIVVEFLIQGSGHVIIRLVRPKYKPSDTAYTWVGLFFWAVILASGWFIYRHGIAA